LARFLPDFGRPALAPAADFFRPRRVLARDGTNARAVHCGNAKRQPQEDRGMRKTFILTCIAAGAMLTMIAQTMLPEAYFKGGTIIGLATMLGFLAAILSKTIQEMARPKFVLGELSRIARRVIVSFRNYGHWRVRASLLTSGRIPALGANRAWWSDGARRPCTARDMAELAEEVGLSLTAITAASGATGDRRSLTRFNWTAEELVFVQIGRASWRERVLR
jgi:hypothetical protein